MKVLIKQAIITPAAAFSTPQDILIHNGIIEQISPLINGPADHLINLPGLHASPGWIDVFANFGDPGYEFKETLETGARAAAAGGFTTVMVIPNTKPVLDNKSQVAYIVHKSLTLAATVIPIGAITRQAEGKDLAEMYDMQNSGAIAFSDGTNSVQSAGILMKALQYVRTFDGVIIQIPDDRSLVPHGVMNEGIMSTRLGLAGKPAMSEELQVARDIKLARYTNSRLHFTAVTSPKSLEYIKRAKEGGIKVTCSVTPYHLFFCDEDLHDYDTNLKVDPPLRTRDDMMALRQAVMEGTIDCIATHHAPQEADSKVVEFEYAKYGMIGLESCYAVLNTVLPDLGNERLINLLSLHAAAIFGLQRPPIAENYPADITLYQPETHTTFKESNIRSASKNSPFIGKLLKGYVAGTIRGNNLYMNQ